MNGVPLPAAAGQRCLGSLKSAEDIDQLSVMKGAAAVLRLGEGARYGAVLITAKAATPPHCPPR